MVHDFQVNVNNKSFSNAIGIEIFNVDHFIVANETFLIMYDDKTYEERYSIDLELTVSKTREPNEILSLRASKDS